MVAVAVVAKQRRQVDVAARIEPWGGLAGVAGAWPWPSRCFSRWAPSFSMSGARACAWSERRCWVVPSAPRPCDEVRMPDVDAVVAP